jgi:hypothetical protein
MDSLGFTTHSVVADPEVQDFGVLMYEEYQKPHGKQWICLCFQQPLKETVSFHRVFEKN